MRNLTTKEWGLEILVVFNPDTATRLAEEILQVGIQEGMTRAARIADGYESKYSDSPVRFSVASGIKHDILRARDSAKP